MNQSPFIRKLDRAVFCSFHQQLQELNDLHYTSSGAVYETALQKAIEQLQQVFPDFTIAFAEIWSEGSSQPLHGGMRHVLMPIEFTATTERNPQ